MKKLLPQQQQKKIFVGSAGDVAYKSLVDLFPKVCSQFGEKGQK
jgi:hypothetical protein